MAGGSWGPQPRPGLGLGGGTRCGELPVGWGPPIPQPLLRAGCGSSCCTDPTQQTAGAPPAPDTPKGLGTPPSLGCSPQTPHSPWGEPGPSTVPPLPPRGRMRVHPSQAHCQLPPRETPALCTVELGGGSTGTARSPSCWEGAVGPPRCTWHPGGAPALPSSARDTLVPSRPFTGVSSLATLALQIHRGLHPPKTPLLPWGCGTLGWAGEGSLCPAASGRGESLARHRSPGALGGGRGAPSRDQTSVEAQRGARVSMHVRVRAQACPRTGAHVLHMGGWGPGQGSPPAHQGPPTHPRTWALSPETKLLFFLAH